MPDPLNCLTIMAQMPLLTRLTAAAEFPLAVEASVLSRFEFEHKPLMNLRIVFVMAALTLLVPNASGAEVTSRSEYETKAGFMLNFAEFVEWPLHVFPDAGAPIVLGVIGEDPFGDVLEKLTGRPVNGRRIEIRRFKGALEFRGQEMPGRRQDDLATKRGRKLQELKGCHILFVSPSERNLLPQVLKQLKGGGILTVGETSEFIQQGGVIGFIRVGGRIQFEINLSAAQEAQLKISSKLLNLARLVEGAPPPERN